MLGSDYTNGVKGIGVVFAVEILNEFGSLEAFRDWILSDVEPTGEISPLQKKLVFFYFLYWFVIRFLLFVCYLFVIYIGKRELSQETNVMNR